MDALRQAFVDHTLEGIIHATNEVVVGAAFVKATLARPPGPDAKAKKAAAARRKTAAAAAAAARALACAKPSVVYKPPPKK
jgi:hypothetical protein